MARVPCSSGGLGFGGGQVTMGIPLRRGCPFLLPHLSMQHIRAHTHTHKHTACEVTLDLAFWGEVGSGEVIPKGSKGMDPSTFQPGEEETSSDGPRSDTNGDKNPPLNPCLGLLTHTGSSSGHQPHPFFPDQLSTPEYIRWFQGQKTRVQDFALPLTLSGPQFPCSTK